MLCCSLQWCSHIKNTIKKKKNVGTHNYATVMSVLFCGSGKLYDLKYNVCGHQLDQTT